jgi:7,8-dihydro-6-hydroxymethylpterin-pyrophosphokinase
MKGLVAYYVEVNNELHFCSKCKNNSSSKIYGVDYIAFPRNQNSYKSNIIYLKTQLKRSKTPERTEKIESSIRVEEAQLKAFISLKI